MIDQAVIAKLREATIDAAQAVIGEHEIGNTNRGKLPDEALSFVGAGFGQPWCAAAACLWVHQGGTVNGPKTASTEELFDWGQQNNAVVSVPQKGDLGCVMDSSSPTGFCHTVLITGGDGIFFNTIEGNEGNAVRTGHRGAHTMKYVNPYALG